MSAFCAKSFGAIRLLVVGGAALVFFFSAKLRGADENGADPEVAPPYFLRNKRPLPEILLKDKRENRYFTGFPAIGWDPETEFGLGAVFQIFDNGPKESPFFRYAPYRRRWAGGINATTGGYSRALIGYDQPYIADTPWRLRAHLEFEANRFENYFGIGEQTLDRLSFPGSPEHYKRYDDYFEALSQVVDGSTWLRYDDYKRTQLLGSITVEHDYLGGLLRPQLGLQISHIQVRDYTGDSLDGVTMQETRLMQDHRQGRIRGFDGGWDNALKVGLTFDSRDFEPDPNSGIMAQGAARIANEVLGSDFNYVQTTLSVRGFYSLLPNVTRLILAGRVSYAMQFGDYPFYAAPTLPFTEEDKAGLGGFDTLRAFKQQRFVGDAAAWANAELRWSFAEKMLGKQHLRFMLVPFLDTGRVFDSIGDTTFHNWKLGGGFGVRLGWNLSTVVSFDWSRSSESTLFYMELGHQF